MMVQSPLHLHQKSRNWGKPLDTDAGFHSGGSGNTFYVPPVAPGFCSQTVRAFRKVYQALKAKE